MFQVEVGGSLSSGMGGGECFVSLSYSSLILSDLSSGSDEDQTLTDKEGDWLSKNMFKFKLLSLPET